MPPPHVGDWFHRRATGQQSATSATCFIRFALIPVACVRVAAKSRSHDPITVYARAVARQAFCAGVSTSLCAVPCRATEPYHGRMYPWESPCWENAFKVVSSNISTMRCVEEKWQVENERKLCTTNTPVC